MNRKQTDTTRHRDRVAQSERRQHLATVAKTHGIPALADFDEHNAALSKLSELQHELRDVESDVGALLAASAGATKSASERLTERARATIAGTDVPPEAGIRDVELEALRDRQRVLVRAVELQKREVARVTAECSQRACEALRPRYIAVIETLHTAAVALAAAASAERDFRDAAEANGIAYASWLPPANFRHIGRLDDPNSYVSHWRREAAEHGYIDEVT